MSDYANSPDLPVDDGIVTTQRDFSNALTMDLTDDEIKKAMEITLRIKEKWERKFKAKAGQVGFGPEEALELIDQMEEELKYELATKLDIYATMDATPIFEGKPPIIEFAGALPSHSVAKQGFDHERKAWEVKKTKETKEDYLGQKGNKANKKKNV